MASLTRVFVYGTLKRGLPNHKLLSNLAKDETARFLSEARTSEKFPVVIATAACVPFLLNSPGVGENIHGEVYEVCQKTLERLDELESVGTLYDRKLVSVVLSDKNFNDECIDANVYIITNFRKSLLDLQLISNYTKEHAKLYKPKTERVQEDLVSIVKDTTTL